MNPDSDSIVELGTMHHPYKELSYALIEMLNYHSHSDRNLTVNMMEGTINILGLRQGSIVNITNVSLITYSQISSEPGKATILVKDKVDIESSPNTMFNIMKTFELRIKEQIFNNTAITEQEKFKVEFNDYNIMVLRSNFMIENMNIVSERADIYNEVFLFFHVYIQDKTITIKNIHFNVSGTISMTYDPLNMNLINIDVDYHRSSGGFEMETFCNYPEAELDTTIFADNLTFYYGNSRTVNPVRKNQLRNQQPGNYIVSNYRSETYQTPNEAKGMFTLYPTLK